MSFESFDNGQASVTLLPKVSEYLAISTQLILAFSVCFQLPVVLFILLWMNWVSLDTLKRSRKYAILLSFVLGAILTPPDPLSQAILALALLLLYESAMWLFRYVKGRSKDLEASEQDDI